MNFESLKLPLSIEFCCPNCFKTHPINPLYISSSHPECQCPHCFVTSWFFYPESILPDLKVVGILEGLASTESWKSQMKEKLMDSLAKKPLKARRAEHEKRPLSKGKLPSLEKSLQTSPLASSKGNNYDLEQEKVTCPKCGQSNLKGQGVCWKCGVVMKKWEKTQRLPQKLWQGPKALKREWDLVCENFDSRQAHQKFIQLCQSMGYLSFGMDCYRFYFKNTGHTWAEQYLSWLEALSLSGQYSQQKISLKAHQKEHWADLSAWSKRLKTFFVWLFASES